MNPRRRRRKNLKAINCWVRPDTYAYIAQYLDGDFSMGMSLDQIIREHKSATGREEAEKTPPVRLQ